MLDRAAGMLALTLGGLARLSAQCPDGSPPPCARAATKPSAPNSLAVLYFDNLSRDSADALLADGFSDELRARLGMVQSLDVKSRGLVQRFRGRISDPTTVGRALGTAYVVSGSLRHAGDRLRVTAELARSAGGSMVWADVFDRSSTDLMTIEAELAEAVAGAITGRLQSKDQRVLTRRLTRNPAAFESYLRGNALIARRLTIGLNPAILAYQDAVQLDSNFAAAWGRLAEALTLEPFYDYQDSTATVLAALAQRARLAADRALSLDSTSAEAWMAHGLVLSRSGHPAPAMADYRRALMLDSNFAEAHYHLGGELRAWSPDQASAEAHLRRAHALDPSLSNAVEWLMVLLWHESRSFEALAWYDTLAAMAGERTWSDLRTADIHVDLEFRVGDSAAARSEVARLLAVSWGRDSVGALLIAARVVAQLRDTAGARALLQRAEQSAGGEPTALTRGGGDLTILVAAVHTALGERDRALTLLEGLQADRTFELWDRLRNPYFTPLRDELRFNRLMESVWPR